MQAGHCKIGYEVAWHGKRLVCIGIYKDVVRFKHHEDTIFLDLKDTVYLPCLKAGLKCVEYHEGVEAKEPFMQVYGNVYIDWSDLK